MNRERIGRIGVASLLTLGSLVGAAAAGAGAQSTDTTSSSGTTSERPQHRGPGLEAAAKALNLSADELKTKLKDGHQTIAEVAKAQNVDVGTVIDAMVVDATTHIDQAVKDNKIDEAKATEIKSHLKDRITKQVNDGPPARGQGGSDGGPPADGNGSQKVAQI